ncbi:hypothetical protein Mapa_004202 [Marchantia paleacea]|nr:hypothetical protein Mapa_004202 [Marchantia paleacea]
MPGADNHGDEQAIDSKHSSHDHWHDGLHHQLWPHHSHARHSDPVLCCSVCCSHTREHQRSRSSDEPEEWSRFIFAEVYNAGHVLNFLAQALTTATWRRRSR